MIMSVDHGDDDVDDGEDLSDAIGVLGGGWFSLPLLTGQRRSATKKMLTNTSAKDCTDIFVFSSYFSCPGSSVPTLSCQ